MSMLTEVGKPSISLGDWSSAKPGDTIQDTQGLEWEVVQNIGEDPNGHLLNVRPPGLEPRYLLMSDMFGEFHIFECEAYGAVPELNDTLVELTKA